ncbi:MAG: hypothetical protein WBE28_10085 [bacterium]
MCSRITLHLKSVEMEINGRQRIGENKNLVLESPEKVIIFFGGLFS